MSFALAQLAMIFLPGLLWASLHSEFGSAPGTSNSRLAINSFLFGTVTYALVYVLYSLAGWQFSSDAVSGSDLSLGDFSDEIMLSIPVSIVLAVAWLYSVRFRLPMKVLNKIGATNRFGSDDVWTFTFNSSQKYVRYADIRDKERGVTFSGYINAYSESGDVREILLMDAIVYSAEGDEISRSPHLYVSLRRDDIWVEFPIGEN